MLIPIPASATIALFVASIMTCFALTHFEELIEFFNLTETTTTNTGDTK